MQQSCMKFPKNKIKNKKLLSCTSEVTFCSLYRFSHFLARLYVSLLRHLCVSWDHIVTKPCKCNISFNESITHGTNSIINFSYPYSYYILLHCPSKDLVSLYISFSHFWPNSNFELVQCFWISPAASPQLPIWLEKHRGILRHTLNSDTWCSAVLQLRRAHAPSCPILLTTSEHNKQLQRGLYLMKSA